MKFGKDKVFPAQPGDVFVFGSNLAGIHGGGAAKYARDNCGAVIGEGIGLQTGIGANRTRSYALPTLDVDFYTVTDKTGKKVQQYAFTKLSITELAFWVHKFHCFTQTYFHGANIFVTKVGCGLAGFEEKQVAPLFRDYEWDINVILPHGWNYKEV